MKPLFIIGMCLILKGNDPWMVPVSRVVEVGKKSYLTVESIKRATFWFEVGSSFLSFEDQNRYELTRCPK